MRMGHRSMMMFPGNMEMETNEALRRQNANLRTEVDRLTQENKSLRNCGNCNSEFPACGGKWPVCDNWQLTAKLAEYPAVSHLRMLDPERRNAIVTQGYFAGAEGIRDFVIKRGLGEVGTFTVEQEIAGKWTFLAQVMIDTEVPV